jgi:uncharacterized protein with PQ loop repeat
MNLAIFATIVSIFATLPQLYYTIRTGVLRDFHPVTLGSNVLGNLLLVGHGLQQNDVGVMLLGGWFTIYNAILYVYLAA